MVAAVVRSDGRLWLETFEPDTAATRAHVMLADLARSQGGKAPRKGAILPAGAWVRSVHVPGAEQYGWCPWCRTTVMLRS